MPQRPASAPVDAGAVRPDRSRRLAAVTALALLGCFALGVLTLAGDGINAVIALGWLFVAAYLTWFLLTRHGKLRLLALPVLLLALLAVGVFAFEHRLALSIWVLSLVLFGVSARAALGTSRSLTATRVPPADRGVLVINPVSGGGAATRADLAAEAARRGIGIRLLQPGDDLRRVVEQAVEDGADVVGMAGGDGSQAVVAAVARERAVAFVCVPAGTRNHLALDLGLDRGDVVGALDAFGEALEHRIDLAAVNGRVFVNTASLGVYASVVQSSGYRNAKLGTWGRMLPDLVGPGAGSTDLRFDGPDTREQAGATLVLVSNNPYATRAGTVAGTRPRLDRGLLGVLVARDGDPGSVARYVTLSAIGQAWRWRGGLRWSAPTFEVRSAEPALAVGLDGEAVRLQPPLLFASLPGAVRVRLPVGVSGASPSATSVRLSGRLIRRLVRIAAGRPDPG